MSTSIMGIMARYRNFLPITDQTPIVSLNEGDTPLIHVPRLAAAIGLPQISLHLKLEGMNPTGSFKDRGMTMAVSKAVEAGPKAIITASTGNTSASAAAYAARSGLTSVVLVPEGNIALGKLSQALMHGAQVLQIQGNFDEALELVKEISESHPITMVNSLNPMRLQGQKTGAFEIVDALGRAPDFQFMPVGNAGNITAYWIGYKEYSEKKKSSSKPRLMGYQAAGSAPIVNGAAVKNPKTIATAIRIGNPASWKQAEQARDESKGLIDSITDEEILEAYQLMPALEGVFAEPASAAGVAGLKKYAAANPDEFPKGTVVVCIITGHGLKDPERAISMLPRPLTVKPDMATIVGHMKL